MIYRTMTHIIERDGGGITARPPPLTTSTICEGWHVMAAHILTVTDTMFKSVKPGYWVGDHGSVLSCRGREPRLLKPHVLKSGHMTVELGRDDARYIHRMVLESFVGPCPAGMECRHLDGDPGNNRLENLAWGTPKENGEDRSKHGDIATLGVFGEANHSSKLKEATVREIIRLRRETGMGEVAIARAVGLPYSMRGAVSGVIHGKSWRHITGM